MLKTHSIATSPDPIHPSDISRSFVLLKLPRCRLRFLASLLYVLGKDGPANCRPSLNSNGELHTTTESFHPTQQVMQRPDGRTELTISRIVMCGQTFIWYTIYVLTPMLILAIRNSIQARHLHIEHCMTICLN